MTYEEVDCFYCDNTDYRVNMLLKDGKFICIKCIKKEQLKELYGDRKRWQA